MQAVTQLVSYLPSSPSSSLPLSVASSCSATTSPSSSRGRCSTSSFSSSSSSPLLILSAPIDQAASVSGRRSSSARSKLSYLWTDHRTSSPHRSRTDVIRGAAGGESAVTSTTQQKKKDENKEAATTKTTPIESDRVKHIKTIAEFDEALVAAKKKLVVVEYAASHSKNSRKIYPAMVDMSKEFRGVVFLLVLGDETEDTKILCERAGIKKVPHFVFYKNSEKIHEEEGITEEMLQGDVLYYGDNDAPIYQVRNKADFEVLLNEHVADHKLLVLDVGLKSCGPCAKVYPTVVTLSKKMADNTVFARMHGDENSECASLLKSMDVKEVPTFVFLRDGKPLGRYVGSGRGELVGEILRYNGVRVTY